MLEHSEQRDAQRRQERLDLPQAAFDYPLQINTR